MFNELSVVIIDSLGVQHQLVQVVNILLYDIRHILKLSEFVTITILEHTFRADDGMTKLTEVLDLLVLMLVAKYFTGASLRNVQALVTNRALGKTHVCR